ncbi:hypothetical protein SAMN05421878_10541 [Actinobaculum suis]|uniref:Uncharacterized protein n=1 Tax=Actinobaculum suis TaxID=1657 RepID=A0A1G7BKA1_9ACTO|nr:hypothetical protein SAMN05421878_10541 [Actinobaculum suis]VDG76605.1 Uncharacterised protein [Actinobaculum suis]
MLAFLFVFAHLAAPTSHTFVFLASTLHCSCPYLAPCNTGIAPSQFSR